MASGGGPPIAIPVTIWCLCFLTVTARHIQPAGSTQTVTCQQHETAVLPFHFPFIPESDIVHVSWRKMETGAEPLVICTLQEGSVEYRTDQYRDRAEVHADASRGKLELILKDVDTSDEGLYKCQAASKKDHGEKVIQLYVELSVKPTEIMAAEGESVTFQADFSGPRTEVVWKIGEDKLVEVDDHGPPYYYRLVDRASVSFHSGSLTIRELVESDSGHYSGNILTEGKYHETKFILKVSPSKPKVHYNVTNGAVTLYCQSVSKGVTYEWRNSSGDLLSTKAICNVSTNTLRINDTMICIVRNKVCKTNSSLTIVNLHTEKISNVSEILKHILIASLGIVSLLVILTIFFLWYFNKNESEQKKVKLYKVIPVFCGALAVIASSSIYIGTGDGLESAVKIAVSSFFITLIVTLCLCMFAIHLRLPYCKRTTDNSSQVTVPLRRMPS